MNNQLTNTFGAKAIVAAALLASVATLASAQERQALTIGYANTPLLQAVKGGRFSMDGRAMLKARSTKPGARLAKADLRNVDMLAADLKEIEVTPEDVELIQAAREAGIPMVIENADGEKMAALFGIGAAGSLIVVEHDPRTHRSRMNMADPVEMEDVPGYVQMPQPNANFGDRVQFVRDIVEKRPFTRGARMQSNLGMCSTSPFNGLACTENEISAPPVYFCPARATTMLARKDGNIFNINNYYLVNMATSYSCAWGMTYVDPKWEAGLYKVKVRINNADVTRHYAIIRATGGWGVVGASGSGDPIKINTDNEQFPFFSLYKLSMMPAGMPQGWSLDNARPSNENRTGTMSSTTGWTATAGVSGGANHEGVSAGVSASISYESTRTSTITVPDWSILNSAGSPNVVISYYMSKTYGCGGTKNYPVALGDHLGNKMTIQCNDGGSYRLTRPPDWSTSGNHYAGALAESVWTGTNSAPFQINLQVEAKVNNVQLWSYNPVGVGWWQFSYVQDDPRRFNSAFYFNPSALTLTK